jgi:fatty acyl-CoA reductase
VLNKLVPIAGDMCLPGQGVSPTDVKILSDNVSIVFHSAATVKFDEALKSAVEMNLKGTMRLIELCRKMDRLDVISLPFKKIRCVPLLKFHLLVTTERL